MKHFFPLISEHDVTLNEYCPGPFPSSITDSCGVISVKALRDHNEDLVAKMIIEGFDCSDDRNEIVYIFKGMEKPIPGLDESSNGSHLTQLNAYMAMRAHSNQRSNLGSHVVGGIIVYLNELWLSDERLNQMSELDENSGVRTDKKDRLTEEYRLRRCLSIVSYNDVISENSLTFLKSTSAELSEKISMINEGSFDPDMWRPGMYSEHKCSLCDFRYSCNNVPEDKRKKVGH